MTIDATAVEVLIAQVTRSFVDGLQNLAVSAAKDAELQRRQLEEQARALALERVQLEEAWAHFNAERARVDGVAKGSPHHSIARSSPSHSPTQVTPRMSVLRSQPDTDEVSSTQMTLLQFPSPEKPLTSIALRGAASPAHDANVEIDGVLASCTVCDQFYRYSVLPAQTPDAPNLGHDEWNQTVELPPGWEVVATTDNGFLATINWLSQRRWGAMVLGVQNASRGFDAYWTPLFSDGSHAGQRCEADVDWIEAVPSARHKQRVFRMTYTGLRLVIRTPLHKTSTSPSRCILPLAHKSMR